MKKEMVVVSRGDDDGDEKDAVEDGVMMRYITTMGGKDDVSERVQCGKGTDLLRLAAKLIWNLSFFAREAQADGLGARKLRIVKSHGKLYSISCKILQ